MKWPAAATAILLTANLQCFPAGALTVAGAAPNLLFLLALFAAMSLAPRPALAIAGAAGVAMDCISAYPCNIHAVLFLGCTAGIVAGRHLLFIRHPLTQIGLAAIAMLFYQTVAIFWLRGRHVDLALANALGRAALVAAYTALVCPLFAAAATRYCRWCRIRLPDPEGEAA